MKTFLLAALLLMTSTVIAQSNFKWDSLIAGEMYSAKLSENRRVLVHLPINYFKDSNKTYPVMYVLDGTSQDQHTMDKISILSSGGVIPDCILVALPNTRGNRERDQTPPFMQTNVDDSTSPFGKANVFLDFIESELVPHIDSNYRTSGYKTISGHSRGALFVFYTLLQRPGLFNARFCYSAPIWRFNDIMIRRIDSMLLNQQSMPASFLFFSAGQNENENIVRAFHTLKMVLEKRKPKQLTWNSYFTPYADHQQNPILSTSRALVEWGKVLNVSRVQGNIIALKGATIIDVENFGKSTRDIKNSVILVRDNKIIAAGPSGKISIPAGAKVIDVSGKFIVPGLLEGFGSVANQSFANAYLYMGVTTVVTVEDNRRGITFWNASPSPALYKQDFFQGCDRVEVNRPDRMFDNINYRTDAQIHHEIDSMAKGGAKVMLIHYAVKTEQIPAVVAACKRNNLAMVGELGFTSYADAIKAGINSFVHTSRYTADVMQDSVRNAYSIAPFGPPATFYYQYIISRNILNDERLQALADLYGKNVVGLIPTGSMLVYPYSSFARNPWQEPIAAIIDEKDILHEPLDKITGKHKNPPPHRAKVAPVLLSMDSLFIKKGAHYLTGSGATAFGTLPGISLHTELEVLSKAGLNNREVLAAATNNFSLIWGWKHIGKIEAGRDADILILDADPIKSIENLKKIDRLLVKGKLIERKTLMNAGK